MTFSPIYRVFQLTLHSLQSLKPSLSLTTFYRLNFTQILLLILASRALFSIFPDLAKHSPGSANTQGSKCAMKLPNLLTHALGGS